MKKLPVGLQGFKRIIEDDLLYIDKTARIYELISSGKLYFLSRPRRFGKSLTISILLELFQGNRDLFKGLHIAEKEDYDWKPYPVLYFSFNNFGHQPTKLEELLDEAIRKYAHEFGVEIAAVELSGRFNNLVENIAKKEKKPVVLLVDEYDKPIVDFINDLEQAKKNQKVLRDFFSPLKGLELHGHLHFLFITGVSKFSKVSLFSDLNNLTDLSNSKLAHDLTGITHEELLANFSEHITHAAQEMEVTEEELLGAIKMWYNGYSFDGRTRLYNPFSLLSFFLANEFANYWFRTGTPTFLVELIRNRQVDPKTLESYKVPDTFFDKFSLEHLETEGLLYQTGYLTIKKAKRSLEGNEFYLGYPNKEVRHAFIYNLLEAFTYQSPAIVGQALLFIKDALKEGDVEKFITQLNVLLSDLSHFHAPKGKTTPTETDETKIFAMWEGYFHTIIYLITSFIGLSVRSEVSKHKGRLDLIAETDNYLYLMEFKLDEPAENAIQQIKERDYANSFQNTPKNLVLVGIGFSRNERTVKTWESEIWER
ncbi:MAG: AAA family ATPase [Bacteroidota bacterium]